MDLTETQEKTITNEYPTGVIQGDCLDVLKTLPDSFVDCCVTSPPYYGLRDYGTGTWVGGDPNCPHKRLNKVGPSTTTGHVQAGLAGNVGDSIYKSVCPLCGAVRVDKQIGLEESPEEYIQKLTEVFHEVRRVMKDDGTLWVNIGDSYNGSCGNHTAERKNDTGFQGALGEKYGGRGNHVNTCKPKDLIGIPWMLAFALRADGWYLRQDIIWHKLNPMPESVKDRCTKSHEYIFLLSKQEHYYFDCEAIQEYASGYDGRKDTFNKGSQKYENAKQLQGIISGRAMAANGHERWKYKEFDDGKIPIRNKRDVWSVPTQSIKEAHFATFPEELIKPCILAGSRPRGIVLDPFFGSGTTGRVAIAMNRQYLGIELNPEYIEIEKKRTDGVQLTLEGLL